MLATVWVLGWIVRVSVWILLIGSGVWLYRSLKLRGLPWLGAYFVLSILSSLITPRIVRHMVDTDTHPFGWTVGNLLVHLYQYQVLTNACISLIVAILILSDIVSLVSKSDATLALGLMRPLLLLHERTGVLGVALIALTLVYPTLVIVFWIA